MPCANPLALAKSTGRKRPSNTPPAAPMPEQKIGIRLLFVTFFDAGNEGSDHAKYLCSFDFRTSLLRVAG